MMKAASAAFTYLVVHPDDTIMQSNLKHYSKLDEVDMDKIVNYEAKVSVIVCYLRNEYKLCLN